MVIQFETAFEKKKSAIETVILMTDRKVVGEFKAIRPSRPAVAEKISFIHFRRMPSVEMQSQIMLEAIVVS